MFVSILHTLNKESTSSGDVKLKYAFLKSNKICLLVYLYLNKRLKIIPVKNVDHYVILSIISSTDQLSDYDK